jgi:hypothetical protein
LGGIIIIKNTRIMKSIAFTSSILFAALFSYTNALELTTQLYAELTTELNAEQLAGQVIPEWGAAPVMMAPTSTDYLSYHGTVSINQWH